MAIARPLARQFRLALTAFACAIAACLAAPAFGQASRVPVEGAPASLNAELERLLPKEAEPRSQFDARRQADRAAEIVQRLLESEGYYAATVRASAEGTETFTRKVDVTTGPLFIVAASAVAIDEGQLDAATQAGLQTLLDPLAVGVPARAAPVLAVEEAILVKLRVSGYPDARANPVDALADGSEHTMEFTFHIAPGQRTAFGQMRIEGLSLTRQEMIERLAPWRANERYSEIRMDEFRTRLAETGLFESATARLVPEAEPPPAGSDAQASRDVLVQLVERERQTILLGASASTSEGIGLTGEWQMRNWSGWGDAVSIGGQVASLKQNLTAAYTRPNIMQYGRNLRVYGEVKNEETDAYDQTGVTAGATLEQLITRRLRGSIGVEAGYASIADEQAQLKGLDRRDVYLLSGSITAEYTGVRDILDPVDGVRARLAVEPGVTYGDTTIGYTRVSGEAAIYARLLGDDRLVGAVRGRVGAILGPNGAPPDKLFFAGGGGSVRGYEYQSLSPRDDENTPVGGRSLIEASAELRYRINPSFGAVAFVDAGAAGEDISPPIDEMRAGVGLGLRYYAGFGPLRADLAFPLDKRPGDADFQIYISIGQAF
jgi:translocation and assembly module TamA